MAKISLISTTIADDNSAFTLAVNGVGEISIPLANLSPEIAARGLIHGLVQKISDAAAIPKSETEGLEPQAVAEMKFSAMQAVASRLLDGDWSARREDGTGPVSGIILRAYTEFAMTMAAKKKVAMTPETIKTAYDAMSKSEQLALRNVPPIAKIIDRIKSERGAGKTVVDESALLAGLGL